MVIRPGRGAIVLGGLAFAVWAAVMAFFLIVAFAPDDWMTGSLIGPGSLRAAIVALAVGVGLATAQLAASLPANADAQSRRSAIAVFGAIIALAIVGIPLTTGKLPTRFDLLTASTLAVCSAVPVSIGSVATSIVWLAVAPCLAVAWIATAFLCGVHVSFLPDTVAMLAPFPAVGGAVLAALFVAGTRGRPLRPQSRWSGRLSRSGQRVPRGELRDTTLVPVEVQAQTGLRGTPVPIGAAPARAGLIES